MPKVRRFGVVAVAAALLAGTVSGDALAVGSTDYTVTAVSGLYEAPPAGALSVGLQYQGIPLTDITTARIDFPFLFPYFGGWYDHARATATGCVRIGIESPFAPTPSDPAGSTAGSASDGVCSPYWQQLWLPANTKVVTWTAGTAPNRRVIVSYEKVALTANQTASLTFQVKLFEGSGRIEFAYKPDTSPSTWLGLSYAIAMIAPGADPRWVAPVNQLTTNNTHPGTDYRFEPRFVTVTGRALYDRLTPTAAGLGTTTTSAPATGVRVEGLFADGRLAGRADTDANGNFTIVTTPSSSASPWEIWISSQGASCLVHHPAVALAASKRIGTNVVVTDDTAAGTFTLTAASDATALVRGPVNVASAIGGAHALVATRTTAEIPRLDVTYDTAAAATTAYTRASQFPAGLTVAGAGAVNEDTWDDGIILRTYGRHLLAALGLVQASSFDDRLDAATTAADAFGAAFGCFLHAAASGQTHVIDSSGGASAIDHDLESPGVAKSPDVAIRVAAALFDLLDPANEPGDPVDGTLTAADRVVQTIDAMTVVPDAAAFLDFWWAQGFDGPGASRIWIAHGLVADDANEPNDAPAESAVLGDLGVRRDDLTLNIGNEDWFDLALPQVTDTVVVDMSFPRTATPATIELELLTAAGARLADKVDAGTGPVTITAGPLAAGTYRVRVVHVAGRRVPSYTLQASRRLVMDKTNLPSWTSGFPYQVPIALAGGNGTRAFAVQSGTAPVGLLFDAANQRVVGTPVQAGTFDFTLAVTDSGSPAHIDLATHHVVVNPPLEFDFGEFIAFAAGKAADVTRPHAGGTAPLVVSLASGALPAGISLAGDGFDFAGTPAEPGSSAFTVHAVDVAGSADDASATAVVCVGVPQAKAPVELAAGPAAAGFWFDGVAGSTAKLAVGTAPKRAKRALRGVVIGPDGDPLANSPVKPGSGKATATVTLPATGRYFLVVASDTGDATQLLATATVTAPKSAKGSVADVDGGDVVPIEFGALAGAKLSLKASPAKGSGLSLEILALIDPKGIAVAIGGLASQKGGSAMLTATLGVSGTWTVRVRATGAAAGTIGYSLKIAEPKGVAYSAD